MSDAGFNSSVPEIRPTKFTEVKIIVPRVFADDRGFFKEAYSARSFARVGVTETFVQDNVTLSKQNVLRGMHYDLRMTKLVQVVRGRVFDAFVDMRAGSPTYKQWDGLELSDENHCEVLIPAGFAHGFLTQSSIAIVMYKQTALYDSAHERAISWRDPEVGIEWPLSGALPILSAKDAAL